MLQECVRSVQCHLRDAVFLCMRMYSHASCCQEQFIDYVVILVRTTTCAFWSFGHVMRNLGDEAKEPEAGYYTGDVGCGVLGYTGEGGIHTWKLQEHLKTSVQATVLTLDANNVNVRDADTVVEAACRDNRHQATSTTPRTSAAATAAATQSKTT